MKKKEIVEQNSKMDGRKPMVSTLTLIDDYFEGQTKMERRPRARGPFNRCNRHNLSPKV